MFKMVANPLLATFGFTLKYWAEKWCLLRRYQKPPLVNAHSMQTNPLPAAIAVFYHRHARTQAGMQFRSDC